MIVGVPTVTSDDTINRTAAQTTDEPIYSDDRVSEESTVIDINHQVDFNDD